jgi:hypothetical protein
VSGVCLFSSSPNQVDKVIKAEKPSSLSSGHLPEPSTAPVRRTPSLHPRGWRNAIRCSLPYRRKPQRRRNAKRWSRWGRGERYRDPGRQSVGGARRTVSCQGGGEQRPGVCLGGSPRGGRVRSTRAAAAEGACWTERFSGVFGRFILAGHEKAYASAWSLTEPGSEKDQLPLLELSYNLLVLSFPRSLITHLFGCKSSQPLEVPRKSLTPVSGSLYTCKKPCASVAVM